MNKIETLRKNLTAVKEELNTNGYKYNVDSVNNFDVIAVFEDNYKRCVESLFNDSFESVVKDFDIFEEMCYGSDDTAIIEEIINHVSSNYLTEAVEVTRVCGCKVETGHTMEEYKERFGSAYDEGILWDFSKDDFENGAIEPNPDMTYWLINDRYYEAEEKVSESAIKENKEVLKEGTSNFPTRFPHGFPLLVFYTIDEVYDRMKYESDYPNSENFESEEDYWDAVQEFEEKYFSELGTCVLDEDEVERLEDKIYDFNIKTRDMAYDADVKDGEQMYGDNLNLEDVKLSVEPGYYEAAYIAVDSESSLDALEDAFKEEQLKRFSEFFAELKKEFGLTEYAVAWGPASNGETGYKKVESYKKVLSDEDIFDVLGIEKENRELPEYKEMLSQYRELAEKHPNAEIYLAGDEGIYTEKGAVKVGATKDLIAMEMPVKESLESDRAKEAYLMGRTIAQMNNEDAYYESGFLYTWPDGETYEDCKRDFSDEESFNDLKEIFLSVYKEYHEDGLYKPEPDVIEYVNKLDKELGLKDIEILESLEEGKKSKGELIAKVIADEFKGECGPFGGEDAFLSNNKVGLHSQAPTEWYTFNDDGTVKFKSRKFASVKDLLHSDLSWFMYIENEDKVLAKVDEILKEEEVDESKKDKVNVQVGGDPEKSSAILNHMLGADAGDAGAGAGTCATGVAESVDDKEEGRHEFCVLVDGNNVDCFDDEEEAVKCARRFAYDYEEHKDSVVKVMLVTYGPRKENGDEDELSAECIWFNKLDESINEDVEDDHKTIRDNDCDEIALTEYEGGEPIGYTKSDKELEDWLKADEKHSWFPVELDEHDEEDLSEKIGQVLDDYGILYGDIVDNDDKINIVGVEEDEWEDASTAIANELDLEVLIPEAGHEELDDELVVIKKLHEASSAEKKAYKNGGKDFADLVQGKAIARIKEPEARKAAIDLAKNGDDKIAQDRIIGDRKIAQADDATMKKFSKMQKAGLKEAKCTDQHFLGEYTKDKKYLDVTVRTEQTRDYVHEYAYVDFDGKHYYGHDKWMNRPWYRFTYANAVQDALSGINKELAKEAIEKSSSAEEAVKYFAEKM